MSGLKANSLADRQLTADSKCNGNVSSVEGQSMPSTTGNGSAPKAAQTGTPETWRARLLSALKDPTLLAHVSQIARESSPLIESTYQPSTPRSSSYMANPGFDYKKAQMGKDE